LLLPRVALAQVFQLTLGETELSRGDHCHLGSVSRDRSNLSCQSNGLAPNFDAVMQVLFERRRIEDLIVHWLHTVDVEFDDGSRRVPFHRPKPKISHNPMPPGVDCCVLLRSVATEESPVTMCGKFAVDMTVVVSKRTWTLEFSNKKCTLIYNSTTVLGVDNTDSAVILSNHIQKWAHTNR
jgi:hypothetical protein